jgi:hypothetical protein
VTSSDNDAVSDTATAGTQADPVMNRIRASVHALDGIADRPLAEHADLYERVHAQLQGELAEIDGGATPA